MESRASTRLGENIKLLTFVSVFFLPLSFCMVHNPSPNTHTSFNKQSLSGASTTPSSAWKRSSSSWSLSDSVPTLSSSTSTMSSDYVVVFMINGKMVLLRGWRGMRIVIGVKQENDLRRFSRNMRKWSRVIGCWGFLCWGRYSGDWGSRELRGKGRRGLRAVRFRWEVIGRICHSQRDSTLRVKRRYLPRLKHLPRRKHSRRVGLQVLVRYLGEGRYRRAFRLMSEMKFISNAMNGL